MHLRVQGAEIEVELQAWRQERRARGRGLNEEKLVERSDFHDPLKPGKKTAREVR